MGRTSRHTHAPDGGRLAWSSNVGLLVVGWPPRIPIVSTRNRARELNYSCGTSGFNPAGRGQSSLRVPPLASFPTSQSNEGGGARKRCRRRWSRRRPTICEFGRPSPTSKTWRRSLRRRRRRCCSWSKRVFNSAHAVRTPQFEGSLSKCSRGGEALKGWMVDQSISRSILRS